jgi:hypothetical protein
MSDDELKSVLGELKRDLTQAFRIEAEDINHKIELVAEGVTGTRETLTRETTDIREEIKTVRHEVLIVAEALNRQGTEIRHEVQVVAKSLDREAADIRQEVRKTAQETQAMIKFSHAELDRRMSRLEEALADLQVRVERLEGSTH